MYKTILAIAFVALIIPLSAQTVERRADMVGAGDPNRGKCTVEVVVDGTAEIQFRGNTASARDVQGQQPQFRRVQCTGVMPANPGNFNFTGVDGRGRQELVQDPRNGGTAVVRISDPQGGAETYTFDLTWDNAQGRGFDNNRGFDNGRGIDNGPQGREIRPQDRNFDQNGGDRRFDRNRRGDAQLRFTPDQGIRVCQDSIRQEAMERFGNVNVSFRQITPENTPGRNDWITGTIVVARPWYTRNEVYRFSCSVDFETGQLRTAHIGVPNF